MSNKLCHPRKEHHCRLCNEIIRVKEPCVSWPFLLVGEGWRTHYAHPECLAETRRLKWDPGDWESSAPGDMERPVTRSSEIRGLTATLRIDEIPIEEHNGKISEPIRRHIKGGDCGW